MNTTRQTGAASHPICGAVIVYLAYSTPLMAETSDAAAKSLLAKYNCQTCHAVDNKMVGPSYKQIAAKYAGDASAATKLEQKVKGGGSGVWGAIPMPPSSVPDADLKTLVAWVLAQK